jgi:type III pantothenate kinase
MNTLVIDAGNTRFKIGVFAANNLVYEDTLAILEVTGLERIVSEWNPSATLLSAVIHVSAEILDWIRLLPGSIIFNADTRLPIENKYLTPQTLGRDRIANAVAASFEYKEQDVLIIDAGTCLKFDFIDRSGAYHGGSISPGLSMRYEALHHYTEMLPLLSPVEHTPLTGRNTHESIHSGVINGLIAEISGISEDYQQAYPDLQLILTGGDHRYFLNHLKKPIFADPKLTLKGLHYILLHNYP